MIGEKMQSALNEQIRHEFYSSYLYLAMAAYFHGQGLDGIANWMKVQAQEELTHAMKFFNHLNDRDGRIQLQGLEKPKTEWASPLQAFKEASKHEQFITGKIHDLVKLANAESDHAVIPLLHWFESEQVEEEAQALTVVQKLERIGESGAGLIMMDKELGKRTFTYPS